MLNINNLHVSVADKPILKGLCLEVPAGEVHAIMGPNGAGKSTLSAVLAGKEGYEITQGSVLLNGVDLLAMEPHERAVAGVFLGFQYPVEIPGIPSNSFLRTAVNALRKARGQEELDALSFLKTMRLRAAQLNISEEMLKRSLNVGFSGGEKKRNEMLQMLLLEPILAILDETDSGLDIDALKLVAEAVNSIRAPHRSLLVITHYQRLLDYIVPDVVHVLVDGVIQQSGDKSLALQLEKEGYAAFVNGAGYNGGVAA
ncbi:MAG: Fe-S cluster assembly ATPase SufC [Alphaproteobacteria bacterium]